MNGNDSAKSMHRVRRSYLSALIPRALQRLPKEREQMSLDYRLSKNAFGRWILVNADDPTLAWSGSRFVPVNENGFPAGNVQISNFDSEEDARETASLLQGLTYRHGSLPEAS
jgi:hypothetical protein